MTRKVILRSKVPSDLHEIVIFLEQRSLAVADRFTESVFRAFDDLASMPGKGSPKEFPKSRLVGIRSSAVPGFPNHLIYFRVHAEAIIVLAVLHGARDVRSILKNR